MVISCRPDGGGSSPLRVKLPAEFVIVDLPIFRPLGMDTVAPEMPLPIVMSVTCPLSEFAVGVGVGVGVGDGDVVVGLLLHARHAAAHAFRMNSGSNRCPTANSPF